MKFLGMKTPRVSAPIGMVSRDDARDAAAREDELRKRRGGQADIITGINGAEAGATGRVRLG